MVISYKSSLTIRVYSGVLFTNMHQQLSNYTFSSDKVLLTKKVRFSPYNNPLISSTTGARIIHHCSSGPDQIRFPPLSLVSAWVIFFWWVP